MVIKKCVVCGKEFDAAQNNYKICSEKCSKKYYEQYNKRYYQDNKERLTEYNKQYYQKNKEYRQQYRQRYYQDNKEYFKQYRQQHYQDNKEYYQQYRQQHYQNNKETYIENRKQWVKKQINELKKQYNGDLNKVLKNIPSRWYLREAQMQVWFNESYYDGIIAKIKSTPCCEVTGETSNLVIHHLYSFSTHSELGNDPANMVRITEDVHKAFHKEYGYGNNTPQQWKEFVSNYLHN